MHNHGGSRCPLEANVKTRRDVVPTTAARRDDSELTAGDSNSSGEASTPEQRQLDKLLVDCEDSDSVLHILDHARQRGIPLATANMVTAFVRLAKVSRQPSDVANKPISIALLEDIWAELQERPVAFSPRQLTDLVFSVSKVGGDALQGSDLLEQVILRRLPEFPLHDIPYILFGFGKVQRAKVTNPYAGIPAISTPASTAITTEVLSRGLAHFTARDIANTLCAFVEIAYVVDVKLLEVVVNELATRGLDTFKPRDLSRLLYAYQATGYHGRLTCRGMYKAAEKYILDRGFRGFSAQEVSYCLNSFASVGWGSDEVYAAFEAEYCKGGVKAFGIRDVVNALWALVIGGRKQNAVSEQYVQRARSVKTAPMEGMRDAARILDLYRLTGSTYPKHVLRRDYEAMGLARYLPQ
eukprot:jgi/Mesvir1/29705/Mv00938-RA.1